MYVDIICISTSCIAAALYVVAYIMLYTGVNQIETFHTKPMQIMREGERDWQLNLIRKY